LKTYEQIEIHLMKNNRSGPTWEMGNWLGLIWDLPIYLFDKENDFFFFFLFRRLLASRGGRVGCAHRFLGLGPLGSFALADSRTLYILNKFIVCSFYFCILKIFKFFILNYFFIFWYCFNILILKIIFLKKILF
jgi:hypothetical protein